MEGRNNTPFIFIYLCDLNLTKNSKKLKKTYKSCDPKIKIYKIY